VKEFMTIFITIFLAELGDKNQLATLIFTADSSRSPLFVFLAAVSALILSTLLAVVAGKLLQQYVERLPVGLIAGVLFIAIGIFAIYEHFEDAAG